MVRLTRIYTKTGDDGTTSLGDASRISKDAPRIEAIGAVDEANAAIGVVIAHMQSKAELVKMLSIIQNDLFDVGADLCRPGKEGLRITDQHVARLEKEIDRMNMNLPKLESFVLPGGSPAAAFIHLARAILRRAERRIVTLMSKDVVNTTLLHYINRLSDYLFVLARWVNHGTSQEILWQPGKIE